MKIIDNIALILVIVGAVNWGLIGLLEFDLVATLFGEMSIASRIVYGLVGIAGIYTIKALFTENQETDKNYNY